MIRVRAYFLGLDGSPVPVDMVLDTGAAITILPAHLLGRVQFTPKGRVALVDFDGEADYTAQVGECIASIDAVNWYAVECAAGRNPLLSPRGLPWTFCVRDEDLVGVSVS